MLRTREPGEPETRGQAPERFRRAKKGRLLFGALLGLFVISRLVSSQAVAAGPARAPARRAGLRWIVSERALVRLLEVAPTERLVRRAFDHPRTWLIAGAKPMESFSSWRCRRVRSFTSFAAMQEQLGAVTGISAVLYDPESWEFTPPAERLNLPHYVAEAARLAHSRGLQLIVTPATDLVRTLLPPRPGRTFRDSVQDLVRIKIAEQIAPATDIYEIQSQGAEPDPELFAWYVTQAAAQVRAANPKALVLAGLSTNPHGLQVEASVMFQEVLATRHLVEGYWLNVPSGGPSCPSCGRARPDIGIQLLELLDKEGLLE